MRKAHSMMESDEGKKKASEMIALFARTTDCKEMASLFEDLFTSAEIDDFILRFALMDDIYKGKSQRLIAKERSLSLCKITRGSKILKKKDGFLRRYFSSLYDDHLHL